MELAKTYVPSEIESKWYGKWELDGNFKPSFDENAVKAGRNYCILLPPPNVTGTLHMGHGFQHTLMDALIRYHRMCGYNTLWQVGTDHAGIATQIVVERQLEIEGVTRHDLGREDFIQRVWQWKKYSGGTITSQMRRLGASCDWSRERFTMDEGLSNAVTEVFNILYERGFIYRGKRLVNWDIQLQTAVSDLEVISVEEQGNLWHIRYPLKDSSEFLVVATTRPETMLGDVAVAVNPEDQRYQHLIGKSVILPLVGREIPIIADDYVDKEFGTGCVKITPAHDFNDYAIGKTHQLEMINILTLDGYINENAPKKYQGMERFAARKSIIHDLELAKYLIEVKPHKLMVPRSDRTNVIIEPMLTDQWFIKMDKLAHDGLNIVADGRVKFIPDNWKTTYDNWLNNIQDWCISRGLWWGHRIPAYYDKTGKFYVARSFAEAAKQAGTNDLNQDNDVLDTWFSSALWAFSTLAWPEQTKELKAFLPSNVLVTGFDIIFFWVARMIMFTQEFTGKVPFKEVFITGLIQDANGNKMSKSKGNVIDPLDLIDGISLDDLIAKRTSNLMNPKQANSISKQTATDYPTGFMPFGADAVRFTFAILATNAREVRFDVKRIEGSRNFCNKLFNATRFVLMNVEHHKDLLGMDYTDNYGDIDIWILTKLHNLVNEIPELYKLYRFDLIAHKLYEFVWNDYCDWYLELAKVNLQSDDMNTRIATINTLFIVLEIALRLLHPLIPFITEELWQVVSPLIKKQHSKSIMLASFPTVAEISLADEAFNNSVGLLQDIISSVRNLRSEMGLNPGNKVPLVVQALETKLSNFVPYIKALAKISEVKFVANFDANNTSPIAIINGISFMLEVVIDVATEKNRISREIEKNTKELDKLQIKLDNKSYVDLAPQDLVKRDSDRVEQLQQVIKQLDIQLSKLG
jgi:valyl-tRNA synthetase